MSEQLNMNIDVCIFEVVRLVRLSSVCNLSLFFLSLDMQEQMHKMFLTVVIQVRIVCSNFITFF